MGIVWSLLAVLAMLGADESPVQINLVSGNVPSWPLHYWQADGEALFEADGLTDDILLLIDADPSKKGHLDIVASTEGNTLRIRLNGDGWSGESDKALRLLRQNLAHEIAHIGQRERLNTAFESRLLHEGYAEARSLDLLIAAKLWTEADARRARLGFEQRCLTALGRGPLAAQIKAGDRDASYACGAVMWLAAARIAGTRADVLHRSYAKAMQEPAGLGPWARATLGEDFTRSAVRFVTTDFSGGPQTAIEGLRAGRL